MYSLRKKSYPAREQKRWTKHALRQKLCITWAVDQREACLWQTLWNESPFVLQSPSFSSLPLSACVCVLCCWLAVSGCPLEQDPSHRNHRSSENPQRVPGCRSQSSFSQSEHHKQYSGHMKSLKSGHHFYLPTWSRATELKKLVVSEQNLHIK